MVVHGIKNFSPAQPTSPLPLSVAVLYFNFKFRGMREIDDAWASLAPSEGKCAQLLVLPPPQQLLSRRKDTSDPSMAAPAART